MSQTQEEHYKSADEIGSDPFHVLDRDNRNHQKKQRIILDAVHADPGDKMLEVGCGDGLHAERYANQFTYYGVDLSDSLLKRASQRIDGTAESLSQMDVMELQYPNDNFNAVVGTAILHHLEDPRKAINEWARVTKPGGSVTLMEPNYLFPKDLLTAHIVEAEKHKTNMAPWRLREIMKTTGHEYRIEPQIYTPPWPKSLHGFFDRVDTIMAAVPGVRWGSQMLLIHVEV